MKRWLWYPAAVLLVAVIGWMPFQGTDVAKLQPVELIRIELSQRQVRVQTDTGQEGIGSDMEAAFEDLKQTTSGQVFLETADYLLLSQPEDRLPDAVYEYLRPGCGICVEQGQTDLEQAAAFLGTHEPGTTLQDYRAGERTLSRLITQEGRMHLVP